MLVSEALTKINYALRGVDDDAPIFGTAEANYWLSTLNQKKNELYDDTNQRWSNTYEVRSVGTISASATPSFDLDDDFLVPSNEVYTLDSANHRTDIRLIHPEERTTARAAFIAGFDPQTLYITNEILSTEPFIGATVYVPGYYMPDDMTTAGDTLPFLDANWAVMAVAAEIAFNDIVYETKAPDLNGKANDLYLKMETRNRRGSYNTPRKVPYNMRRIRAPDRR